MKRFGVVVLIAAGLAALFIFGLKPREARDINSPIVGKTLDDFEAPLIERYQAGYGEDIRYGELLGQPLFVIVWESWSIPACWNEAPRWKAAWERFGDQVMILGVNYQDNVSDANTFLDRFDKQFPSVRDPQGKIGIAWGVFGVPETYFIRPDGTLLAKKNGEISSEEIERYIQELLDGS